MLFIGYIAGILVGMVLGLFGSGGAIISFPVLVYFMGMAPTQASVYSLIIVGIAAITGAIKYLKEKEIEQKVVLVFTVPLLISFYVFKQLILPAIPSHLFYIGPYIFTKDNLIMLLFIIVLSYIVYKMLMPASASESTEELSEPSKKFFSVKSVMYSGLTGMLAASIGAGGGFIIVPALMNIFNLSIKKATGTSLLIIALNSLLGSIINLSYFSSEHLQMITIFTLLSITGIFIGTYLHKILQSITLKKSYAYFLMTILLSTLITEIIKKI